LGYGGGAIINQRHIFEFVKLVNWCASTSTEFFDGSTDKAGYLWHRFEKCAESNLFECEELVAVGSGNYSEIPNNSGSY